MQGRDTLNALLSSVVKVTRDKSHTDSISINFAVRYQ